MTKGSVEAREPSLTRHVFNSAFTVSAILSGVLFEWTNQISRNVFCSLFESDAFSSLSNAKRSNPCMEGGIILRFPRCLAWICSG
jgi:hypothetical protein